MNSLNRYLFAASVSFGSLLVSSSAGATQIFKFNGVLDDGDQFNLTLETSDILTIINAPAHTNVLAGLTSPAYTFEGYLITDVSGYWFEKDDLTTPLEILELLPAGSIIENSERNDPPGLDTIAHSPTDNLFNPDKGFGSSFSGLGGKFSYGGIQFTVAAAESSYGSYQHEYQLYTDPTSLGYAGCPGSCVGVTEVPTPASLPLLGLGLVLIWSRRIFHTFSNAKRALG